MDERLSSALAVMFLKGQHTPDEGQALLDALDPSTWAADIGPLPIVVAIARHHHHVMISSTQKSWASWMDDLLRHRLTQPLTAELGRTVWTEVLKQGKDEALASTVWNYVDALLPDPDDRLLWLSRLLDLDWTKLAKRLLAGPITLDLSPTENLTHLLSQETDDLINPFAVVRDDVMLQALLHAGFSPSQKIQGMTGYDWVRQREMDADRPYRKSGPRPLYAPDMLLRMKECLNRWQCEHENNVEAVLQRMIDHGRNWTEFRDLLKSLGDRAWHARFTENQTLLHRLASRRPAWLAPLFRWRELATAPDELFNTSDSHGIPSLWYRLMDSAPYCKNFNDEMDWIAKNRTDWFFTMQTIPAFQRWLSATPRLVRPDEGLHFWFTMMERCVSEDDRPHVDWDHPTRWALAQHLGGWGARETAMAIQSMPAWQQRMDRLLDHGSGPDLNVALFNKLIGHVRPHVQSDPSSMSTWFATLCTVHLLRQYLPNQTPSDGLTSEGEQVFHTALDQIQTHGVTLEALSQRIAALGAFPSLSIGTAVWPVLETHLQRTLLQDCAAQIALPAQPADAPRARV